MGGNTALPEQSREDSESGKTMSLHQSQQNKIIAETILSQLGGSKFIAMVGAYNLMYDKNALVFKFKGSSKATACMITLDLGTDTYIMKFVKVMGYEIKNVAEIDDVYCDNLQHVFTSVTGLDCHL